MFSGDSHLYISSLVHPFNKYCLYTYFVLSIFLGPGDTLECEHLNLLFYLSCILGAFQGLMAFKYFVNEGMWLVKRLREEMGKQHGKVAGVYAYLLGIFGST